eukprot:12930593-Prorocentrum_lima.AAC.1
MKKSLQEWWKMGTTKERLISSGANLRYGFLSPTKQFKHMNELSYGNDKGVKGCESRLVTLVKRQIKETPPGD